MTFPANSCLMPRSHWKLAWMALRRWNGTAAQCRSMTQVSAHGSSGCLIRIQSSD